jgi:pentose-5-phosphate-3-epimerase
LGNLSEFLRGRGLISEITSITLLNAGDKFDRFGVQKDPEAKFNALEYFATQLDAIQTNSLNGNYYGKSLIPEFKKAIYVLQNLKTYGEGNAAVPSDKGLKAKA